MAVKRGGDAFKLAEAKLASSGLNLDDAKALGIKVLSAEQTAKLAKGFPSVPSLMLRYHSATGDPLDVYRIRMLEQPAKGFGASDTKLRYLQTPGTAPAIYLPASEPWPDHILNVDQSLLITEGELKAACACKHGFPTIGLGGVSSWRSAKRGLSFLPELEEFVWRQRRVVICFDSDAWTNPDIMAATSALVRELAKRGAQPAVARLPEVEGLSKTGLDDLITNLGPEALAEALAAAPSDDLSKQLWAFNEQYVTIDQPPVVYDLDHHHIFDPAKFTNFVMANVFAVRTTLTASGSPKLVETPVAKAWVEWPLRQRYRSMTYEPGGELIVDNRLNTWPGWGCEAKPGSVALWTQLLDHLFQGATPEARAWFEAWCLYPLAHPGTKIPTAAVMWSLTQGVGKSVIGKLLGRVYGTNYAEVSQEELESTFNGWQVHKQLVMFDDVSAYANRSKSNALKKRITAEHDEVNIKGIPTYQVPAKTNYYLTSNEPNALYLDDQDRRFFVHEVTAPVLPREFWAELYPAMGRVEGYRELGPLPGALLAYAQSFDFSGFKPFEKPPETAAKAEMVLSGKGEVEAWVAQLKVEPASILKLGEKPFVRDLFTSTELLALFNEGRQGPPVTSTYLGMKLRQAFPLAARGQTLRPNGSNERFYIVREVARWAEAARKDLEKHVSAGRQAEGSGRKF